LILGDSKRYNHTFSLVVIDLNKFKIINDTYGHAMGDKVLIFFSQLIHKLIRETDYLFRMGGDEFYLLLTNTSANNADVIIKKLQNKLSNEKFIYENIEIELSSSFGTAEYGLDGLTIDELIVIADFRMYENKKSLHNIKE
jgi:diguanylate cyclase (GGDEF)-like protein